MWRGKEAPTRKICKKSKPRSLSPKAPTEALSEERKQCRLSKGRKGIRGVSRRATRSVRIISDEEGRLRKLTEKNPRLRLGPLWFLWFCYSGFVVLFKPLKQNHKKNMKEFTWWHPPPQPAPLKDCAKKRLLLVRLSVEPEGTDICFDDWIAFGYMDSDLRGVGFRNPCFLMLSFESKATEHRHPFGTAKRQKPNLKPPYKGDEYYSNQLAKHWSTQKRATGTISCCTIGIVTMLQ